MTHNQYRQGKGVATALRPAPPLQGQDLPPVALQGQDLPPEALQSPLPPLQGQDLPPEALQGQHHAPLLILVGAILIAETN